MDKECGLSSTSFIDKRDVLSSSTIPDIPVYRPSWDEFKNFSDCISKIESLGGHHVGLCKIIPPTGWNPRMRGYNDLNDLVVAKPICQTACGGRGIYIQEFKEFTLSNQHRTPPYRDYWDLEKKYWSSIGFGRPLYGANVSGSLTDSNLWIWNVANLESILSDVFKDVKIPGVNTPYLYYGMWRSTFPWHTEDVELYSINYLHYGSPKFWYVIPPAFARKFESFVFEYFRSEFLNCKSFLRHKCVLINPKILEKVGIPTKKIIHNSGEFMVTFPYAYHAGFNTGLNIAESTNFALPRWIEFGKKAKVCTCWDDTVKISMDPFVKKYQPHLYEKWKSGKDDVPHPLDEYVTNAKNVLDSSFIKFILKEDVCTQKPSKCSYNIEVGDLNDVDLRFSLEKFRSAKLPYHIEKKMFLRTLWCDSPLNLDSVRLLNKHIGQHKPYCSVCSFSWTPQHFAKVLSNLNSNDLPICLTEPYIPEVAFRTIKTDIDVEIPVSIKSQIFQCSSCFVTVHARCYGINDNIFLNSELVQTRYNGDVNVINSVVQQWLCDACRLSTNPSCVFCYLRGGAMKALENPINTYTKRKYWAHLVCLLATPGCYFSDVNKRLAFISKQAISLSLEQSDSNNAYNKYLMKEQRLSLQFDCTKESAYKTNVSFGIQRKEQRNRTKSFKGNIFFGSERDNKNEKLKPSVCLICRLPGRGNLPLASCWFRHCPAHFHVTCAQMAGVMIGVDVYPRFFYIACDKHPANYHNHTFDEEVEVNPGDTVVVRKATNPPKFLLAVAVRIVTPRYCRIAFPDGTFSSDTPLEYLTSVDCSKDGLPLKGSTVKVLWDDNMEYTGTFEGATVEKWEVKFKNGERSILNRGQFYVHRPED